VTRRPARLGAVLRRLLGGDGLPAGFTGRLEADERVVATARTVDGDHLLVTSWGLWLPGPGGPRRVGWHLVSRAVWRGGALAVVEAEEVREVGDGDGARAVLLADRPARRFRLDDPGHAPEAVHARVEGSIRSRHHLDLSGSDVPGGGGAWFVQRRVPGRDGTVLQVRPDPGTDPAVVAQVAADVARSLGRP
jgi:hypothetical protein